MHLLQWFILVLLRTAFHGSNRFKHAGQRLVSDCCCNSADFRDQQAKRTQTRTISKESPIHRVYVVLLTFICPEIWRIKAVNRWQSVKIWFVITNYSMFKPPQATLGCPTWRLIIVTKYYPPLQRYQTGRRDSRNHERPGPYWWIGESFSIWWRAKFCSVHQTGLFCFRSNIWGDPTL